MAEPAKYFDNVTLGQFVLTGIPVDVFVDGAYLRITEPDDIEDPMYGSGMDQDGAMHPFDYRMIDHILVNGNNITLDKYNKAMGATATKEEPAAEEEEASEEETTKEESTMKLKPMLKNLTKEDVNSARAAVQKEKEKVAAAEEKLANAQSKYAKEKMKAAKMEENADVTSVSEPYMFKVGDMVRNTNPSCTHFGSMGIIQKLLTLPNDMGTLVKYTVTNNGDTYSAGDSLTKTMDQLTLAHDGEEIDFNDYSDDLDDYDVVDYDFGDDVDDDDWEDGEDYEYYDDEEDED